VALESMSYETGESFKNLASFPHLPRLKTLSLTFVRLNKMEKNVFDHLTCLRELTIVCQKSSPVLLDVNNVSLNRLTVKELNLAKLESEKLAQIEHIEYSASCTDKHYLQSAVLLTALNSISLQLTENSSFNHFANITSLTAEIDCWSILGQNKLNCLSKLSRLQIEHSTHFPTFSFIYKKLLNAVQYFKIKTRRVAS
jgi:hypothetical protein